VPSQDRSSPDLVGTDFGELSSTCSGSELRVEDSRVETDPFMRILGPGSLSFIGSFSLTYHTHLFNIPERQSGFPNFSMTA
jgi:hypothetical protein